MLDFVKKLFGLKKETQSPNGRTAEGVIDAVDMTPTLTTKVDGIGHETVVAEKKPNKVAKPRAKKPKQPKA